MQGAFAIFPSAYYRRDVENRGPGRLKTGNQLYVAGTRSAVERSSRQNINYVEI